MKNFLAIFLGTPAAMAQWNELSDAERNARQKKGIEAWGAWVEQHKEHIVDLGTPLGKTKAVDVSGISDVRNAMAVYMVVRAAAHADAAGYFEGHPHFTIFPGESIEVMECLPVPGSAGG